MKARLSPGPEVENQRWNIVRGDNVEVIQGKSTGQKGKVLAVIRESSRLIIDGVNMVNLNGFCPLSSESHSSIPSYSRRAEVSSPDKTALPARRL